VVTPRRYLALLPAGFLPIFALPLLLDPYGWAKRFGWKPEPQTDVGLYFGRCLGAVATAICVESLRLAATDEPDARASVIRLTETASWLLSAVHARGMLEGRQPPIEHAEIAGYAGVALLARSARRAP
jgi:hypothetical protein